MFSSLHHYNVWDSWNFINWNLFTKKKNNNILNWETKENIDMIYESKVPYISVVHFNRPVFITVQAKQGLTLGASKTKHDNYDLAN